MAQAKNGDTVRVHYTGTLADGSTFDSSVDREPLEFTLGEDQMIPGFEKAVLGMAAGDKKQVVIPADEAYGDRRDELMVTVSRSDFPENIVPEVGQQLQLATDEGYPVIVTVKEVGEEEVILDANPPLAGEDLTFDLELVAID